ncbi:unnamed protein product [Plutella xylostella]|uniref:Metalloendopeptidase n=1 Tax=Plutella xylostella TaxID=51655 RepID=A0A8S4E6F2_PLUXY|nr:unnamed protein product [Plutella xylostella]
MQIGPSHVEMHQVIVLLVCAASAIAAPVMNDRCAQILAGKDLGELGDYFEGDMMLTAEQMRRITEAKTTRNGLTDPQSRWPNRTVVYHIVEGDFDEGQVKMIKDGMQDIANKSCIKFRPRKHSEEYSVIIQGSNPGCSSDVGYKPKDEDGVHQNRLNLHNKEKGCFRHGSIVHELLHTLGFYHMQSTYNRDEYVKIVVENIREGYRHNFYKYNNDTVTNFGVEYDYGSVMHYPADAFSKNGEDTIIVLRENAIIGQRVGMSESDVLKLNRMYCEQRHS